MEQAKILVAEAEENNLRGEAYQARWERWHHCSLCEQDYHGVVNCAFSWACWKTYVGRPEADTARCSAMTELGNGLQDGGHHEDALAVREAELSTLQRLGAPAHVQLIATSNLATSYCWVNRFEEALRLRKEAYAGYSKVIGRENRGTMVVADNYAESLIELQRFKEAKSVLRREIPVARRVLGDCGEITLSMRMNYAMALYRDTGAALDDLRVAVTTLEELIRTVRRVFGGQHPLIRQYECSLRESRATLRARETPPTRGES